MLILFYNSYREKENDRVHTNSLIPTKNAGNNMRDLAGIQTPKCGDQRLYKSDVENIFTKKNDKTRHENVLESIANLAEIYMIKKRLSSNKSALLAQIL